MDPNLFHVDFERLFEVLMTIVVLSFFIERALSVLFGHRLYVRLEERGFKGAKEVVAFTVSVACCYYWQFDALSILLVRDTNSKFGYLLTGGIIAGGSKASLRLFYEIMDVKTQAERDYVAKTRGTSPSPSAPPIVLKPPSFPPPPNGNPPS
jgi:hypothetical protein